MNKVKNKLPNTKPCGSHKKKRLGYVQAYNDAVKRTKAGQKQIRCPKCKYWFWPDQL